MRITAYVAVDDWLRPPALMTERALRRAYMMGTRDFEDVWLYRCSLPAWPRWVLGFNADVGPLSHRQFAAAMQGGSEFRNDTGFRVLPDSVDIAHLVPYRRVSTTALGFRAWLDHSLGISLPVLRG